MMGRKKTPQNNSDLPRVSLNKLLAWMRIQEQEWFLVHSDWVEDHPEDRAVTVARGELHKAVYPSRMSSEMTGIVDQMAVIWDQRVADSWSELIHLRGYIKENLMRELFNLFVAKSNEGTPLLDALLHNREKRIKPLWEEKTLEIFRLETTRKKIYLALGGKPKEMFDFVVKRS